MSALPISHVALPPLQGSARVLGTLAVSMATFMNVLDSSIANVSIPAISGNLGVSPSQGTWVITSFGVANAISLPLTGWLAQRFGQVRLFMTSVLLFVLASWLCGLAWSLEWLLAFRVLQGAVAGPMIPLSQTLLLGSYPREKAGTALGLWSMTTLIAPVMGPVLGGWITDNIAWPWIFYINVPIGLLAASLLWLIYRDRETPTLRVPVDVIGLALLVIWVGALQIVLDKGKESDWFASTEIIVLTIVAAIALVVFLVWELTDDHPIVDLSLFSRRSFLVGALALSLGYALFFGNVVLLPLWLQQYMGYTATWAGLIIAPVGLVAMCLTPWVGRYIDKGDPRLLSTVSFLTFGVVFWLRAQFNVEADWVTLIVPTFVQGFAAALFFIPLVSVALSGVPPERMAAASGLSNFMRITAGAFGVSIATTVWENRAITHHAQLVESVTASNPALDELGRITSGVGLSPDQSMSLVARMLDQQAFTVAVNEVFLVTAFLHVGLAIFIWLAPHTRRAR